jgi:hypothetical protein
MQLLDIAEIVSRSLKNKQGVVERDDARDRSFLNAKGGQTGE